MGGNHLTALIRVHFILPTPSERFVQRDNCQKLIALGARQIEFCREKLLLSLQHLVIIGFPGHVPLRREFHRGFQGGHFVRLMLSDFNELLSRNERV
jgi:hypothetical protein